MTLLLDQSLSFAAAHRLGRVGREQRDTFARLATGVRVRSGADGPADLIRATALEANLRQTEQSVLNAERASGAVNVADAALGQVTENLREVRRLVMESTSNTLTSGERAANQDQIDSILRQTDRIFFDTEFAGTRLFRSVPKDTQEQAGIGMHGQVGHIDADQSTPGATQRFTFAKTLSDPVVIAGPLSHNDGDPAHVRVHNVDDNGFDFEIEEWDYLDGIHGTERFGFLALEPGVHNLKDGTIVEVGRANVNHNFRWINFSAGFTSTPTILTSVQTENDATPITTRIRNDSATRFRVRVQEEEQYDKVGALRPHANETVAWVAIQTPAATATGNTGEGPSGVAIDAQISGDDFSHLWRDLGHAPLTNPVLFAQVTYDGADTAALRHRNPTGSGAQIQIDEETSRDPETNHTRERLHAAVFDRPAIIAPYVPPPILDPEDLAGQLPGDPTTLEQSALVFNVGPGAREGLAALRFEETSSGTLGTDFNKLLDLKTGGALDVRDTPSQDDAIAVLDESIKQVGRMRNRAGRFSKYVIDSAVRYQQAAVAELADAGSQIRDADFAFETGELTRQQIMSQAVTSMLGVIAQTQRDNLLTLLG